MKGCQKILLLVNVVHRGNSQLSILNIPLNIYCCWIKFSILHIQAFSSRSTFSGKVLKWKFSLNSYTKLNIRRWSINWSWDRVELLLLVERKLKELIPHLLHLGT